MKKIFAFAAALAFAAPALAQSNSEQHQADNSAQTGVITCWYSDSGKFTSAGPAERDEHLRYLYLTGRGGNQAWAYAIRSTDAQDCPRRTPH